MISEGQARVLLHECEAAVGRRLASLRSQLLKSHDTLGALWELITLYTATQLGTGVDHEPNDGRPDILVEIPGVDRFWIEATHIAWPERDASDAIMKFSDWIRRELKRRHGVEPNSYRIRLDPVSPHEDAVIPPEHVWAQLRQADEWKRFADAVKAHTSEVAVTQLSAPFLVTVKVERYDKPSDYLSSAFRTPKAIKKVSDHPVWKALRSKGEQARRFKLPEPIVLCIGSSLGVSLFDSLNAFAPAPGAAVAGALYDTSKWHVTHQYNQLRDTSGECYQVQGAGRLSAVLLVSIEEKKELSWLRRDHNRIARTQLVLNREARHPLSGDQVRALSRMQFNAFPYGPQWETWQEPSRPEWKNSTRIMKRSEPGKTMTYATGKDGSFDLHIPAEDITKLLAGVNVLDELLERIRGIRACKKLSELPPIERAELIPGDPKLRKAAMLKLTFGPPSERIVQGLRIDQRGPPKPG